MANVTEELNFFFYLIFISVNLNLKSCMLLVAILLDSIALNRLTGNSEENKEIIVLGYLTEGQSGS